MADGGRFPARVPNFRALEVDEVVGCRPPRVDTQ